MVFSEHLGNCIRLEFLSTRVSVMHANLYKILLLNENFDVDRTSIITVPRVGVGTIFMIIIDTVKGARSRPACIYYIENRF